ncbi:alpha/beta fold hydrolase [Arthrobacter sp. zg-Y1219]|uniref:alpha/beta hydrolase family protein n=1 Tax=Arthrobacter sp. zg-Y1219 TaxID=3049067 RepID=UPI0024C316A0|nr:alpha/beta fold hydrolase [Arthrobacter sp. zg-Y1219]MDK1361924.1 alpha/beta fold hydrolase [Arthrobacter sp. zg-Y1219]
MPNKNAAPVTSAQFRIPVAAGGAVAGTLRTPTEGLPVGAVVIHSATAVAQRLYSGFAEYLAGNGLAVLTYDYRGIGASGSPKRNRHLRMRDWMEQDVPAVTEWMAGRFPGLPQLAVGHSLGGQALVLGNGTEDLAGFVTVASHGGVTRAVEVRGERIRVELLLRVVGPLCARLLGFAPARRLGLGEDMPGTAVLEWGGWSRKPGYFFDDPGMHAAERAARVKTDVLAIGISDDLWATTAQIGPFFSHLVNAHVEQRIYTPVDVGVPAIGHMGFFRRGMKDKLWPDILDWLKDRAGFQESGKQPA